MKLPVVFLAFANRAQDPFLDLSEEDDAINDLFLDAQLRDDNNGFQLQRFSRITSGSLIKYLNAFDDQISIFHYAGHAGKAELFLSDQGARGQGLAALLGRQTNLRCVFLNGCNTKDLVDDLLAKNVPVVIATDRKVEDQAAIQLSKEFYAELTSGNSIRTSFENAVNALQVTDGREVALRGGGSRKKKKAADAAEAASGVPWGIYYKNAKALNWQLSQSMSDIQKTTDFFWVRLLALFFSIFILFSWSNRHIGVDSTAFFLSTGPLTLLAIGIFIMNAFRHVSPAISKLSKRISYTFLKTPVLLGIGLFVGIVVSCVSSVEIEHPGVEALDFSVKNKADKKMIQWPIPTEEPEKSRVVLTASPFQSDQIIEADGYQPFKFKLPPIVGSRLDLENFVAESGLLIRLDRNYIVKRNFSYLILESDSIGTTVYDTINPILKASVLIGPDQTFSEQIKSAWKSNLSSWGKPTTEKINEIFENWSNPNKQFTSKIFKPGEKVKFTLMLRDSILLTKTIEIKNKRLNDIFLKVIEED